MSLFHLTKLALITLPFLASGVYGEHVHTLHRRGFGLEAREAHRLERRQDDDGPGFSLPPFFPDPPPTGSSDVISSTTTSSTTSSTTTTSSSTTSETTSSTTTSSTTTEESSTSTTEETTSSTTESTSSSTVLSSSTRRSTAPTSSTQRTALVVNPTNRPLSSRSLTVSVTESASFDDDEEEESNGPTSFMENKTAVAATFTVVGLVGLGAGIFVFMFIRKRVEKRREWDGKEWEDVNDNHMTEFVRPPPSEPNTAILPSQSLGAAGAGSLSRGPSSHGHGSSHHGHNERFPIEEPDELLAMPPVMAYERPRDSAYDIVPAAPPPALKVPGNHTSFGSGIGQDPFAGGAAPNAGAMGWQDANRDSTALYGPSVAGRGAGGGYNMPAYDGGAGYEGHQQQQHAYGQQWTGAYGGANGYGYAR